MAAELKLLQNDEPRQVFPLPQGVLTIGRDPTNHIQLDSPAVNARHARIFTVGDASVIQNISGSSGIFINDEEIVRRELHNEDIIHIGSHRFQFVNPDAPARPVAGDPTGEDEPGEELAVALPSQPETDDQPVISRLQQDAMDDIAADLEAETVTSGSAGPDIVSTLSAPDDAIAEPEAADTPAPEIRLRHGNVYQYPSPSPMRDTEEPEEPTPAVEPPAAPEPRPLAIVSSADDDAPEPVADLTDDAATLKPLDSAPDPELITDPTPGGDDVAIGANVNTETEPRSTTWGLAEPSFDESDKPDYTGYPSDDDAESPEQDLGATWPSMDPEPESGDGVFDPGWQPPEMSHWGATDDSSEERVEIADFPRLTAGIEVLRGPNSGKRLLFSKPRIVLGKSGGRSVVIERHDNEYRIHSADRGAAATLNGTLLLKDPVPLSDGDRIEFAELTALFYQRAEESE